MPVIVVAPACTMFMTVVASVYTNFLIAVHEGGMWRPLSCLQLRCCLTLLVAFMFLRLRL